MYKFIKYFFSVITLLFFANSFVYADTLSDAIAAADCDREICGGVCTQTNNIITIAETGNEDEKGRTGN